MAVIIIELGTIWSAGENIVCTWEYLEEPVTITGAPTGRLGAPATIPGAP